MKSIELKSIEMWNFKGEEHRLTEFGNVTNIFGGNGLGKSRHFAAFCWCLWGKDQFDRKDYEILTRENGEIVPKRNAEVEIKIIANGTPIKLHRSLTQNWAKPRGTKKEVYKGNETECFINDVPTKVGEYTDKVNAILDDSLFKLLSNPYYFCSILDWKAQRDMLFRIAGAMSDEEIAGNNADFVELLHQMEGKSFEDFAREVSANLKRLKPVPAELNTRIEQTEKLKPEAKDWAELENKAEELKEQIREKHNQIAGLISPDDEHKQQVSGWRNEITSLKAKQSHALYMAQQDEDKKAMEKNADFAAKSAELRTAKAELQSINDRIEIKQKSKENLDEVVKVCTEKREELSKEWYAENDKVFNGDLTCPTCGQPLPPDKVLEMKDAFNKRKAQAKAEITAKGLKNNANIDENNEKIASYMKEIKLLQEESDAKTNEILGLQDQLGGLIEAKPQQLTPADVPEYAELQAQIDDLQKQIDAPYTPADTSDIKKEIEQLQNESDDINRQLGDKRRIEMLNNEIESLNEKLEATHNDIAKWEKLQYNMIMFAKAKADILQERINNKFRFVKFQLFTFTLEGNASETCIPQPLTNDGYVPFGTANRAAQINAGLDIINAMCEFYDTTAPIFIDNAEAIVEPIETKGQKVLLSVTNGETLTIETK